MSNPPPEGPGPGEGEGVRSATGSTSTSNVSVAAASSSSSSLTHSASSISVNPIPVPTARTVRSSSSPNASPETPTDPQRPGLTGRFRSGSRSSLSSPTLAKLNKRYSHSYHSRPRPAVPAPKVLPFPDLSARTVSRDASRAGSPTHGAGAYSGTPLHTPRGSSTDVTLSGMLGLPPGTTLSRRNSSLALPTSAGMVGAASWEGSGTGSGGGGRDTPVRRVAAVGSPSPPAHSASPRSGSATPHITFPINRPRAQTGPVSTRPIVSPGPQSILRTSTISPPPSPAPRLPAPTVNPIPIPSRSVAMITPPPPPIEKDRPARTSKKVQVAQPAAVHSVSITPAAPTQPLADHLYDSFIKGHCADVRLWVRKWGVSWKVHKIVLVQAGFFNSLFLGGFSETRPASARVVSRKGKERARDELDDWMGEDVELKFDDPNITRAAFEICLSRLYSPHPRLHFPTMLLPTALCPLTPSFPQPLPDAPQLAGIRDSLPAQTQLATPRLLLSLLATSVYLGHHSLMREVMTIVLRTVGPRTIGRYLGFAVGDGIGEEEWDDQHDEAARGLEGVAQALPSGEVAHPPHGTSPSRSHHRDSTASDGREEEVKVGSAPSATSSAPARETSARGSSEPRDSSLAIDPTYMPHFYGTVSNKIGEACVCWLSRWALDILRVELSFPLSDSETDSAPWRIFAHRGIPARFVRALLSSDTFFVQGEMERYSTARAILDLRRRGWERELAGDAPDSGDIGLAGAGASGTVLEEDEEMGDAEAEAYELWDEDEAELAKVFADGVYYSHMSFEDLSVIARDVDPATHLPYAPLSVLQAAHWAAADLKARVIAHDVSESSEQPAADADTSELGLSLSGTAISQMLSRSSRRITPRARVATPSSGFWTPPNSAGLGNHIGLGSSASAMPPSASVGDTVYHPIPVDDTYRSGAGGLLFQSTPGVATAPLPGIPGLPDFNGTGETSEDGGKKRAPPQSERTFFGLLTGARLASEIASNVAQTPHTTFSNLAISNAPSQTHDQWTKTQPFRFSVEFWNVDKLAEKERLYSTTHFHAGSWWNVYVQTIRKKDKGTQLGIYLHRQSATEGFPPASAPPRRAGDDESDADEDGGDVAVPSGTRWPVLEGYGTAGNDGWDRERRREVRSLSEGGTDRANSAPHRRARGGDPDRAGLSSSLGGGSSIQGATLAHSTSPTSPPSAPSALPRPASIAAGLGQSLGTSPGSAGSAGAGPAMMHGRTQSASFTSPGSVSSTAAVVGAAWGGGAGNRAGRHAHAHAHANSYSYSHPSQGAATAQQVPHDHPASTSMRRASSREEGEGPYRDTRKVTRAYFSITCASALGTALIRFSSLPDSFTLSQSWGWKSSALRSEEYLATSAAHAQAQAQAQATGAGAGAGAAAGGAPPTQADVSRPERETLDDGVMGWFGTLPAPGQAGMGQEGQTGSLRATVVVGVI